MLTQFTRDIRLDESKPAGERATEDRRKQRRPDVLVSAPARILDREVRGCHPFIALTPAGDGVGVSQRREGKTGALRAVGRETARSAADM